MKRGLLATAAIMLVTAAVAAAGLASGSGQGVPELRLSDFRIAAPSTLPAGRTEVVVRNTGRLEHDLVVVRTRRAAERLPVGLNGVAPQLAGKVVFGEPHGRHGHAAAQKREASRSRHHYPAGSSTSVALRLRRGRYVLLCSLPGHYEQGQRRVVEVR